MNLKSKLISAGILLLLLPMLIISSISFTRAKKEFDTSGEILLRNAVEQAMYMVELQKKSVASGAISLEEAQENIKVLLLGPKDSEGKRPINDNIYLGGTGYFVVYSTEGIELMHPSLEGVDVWEAEDKSGSGMKLVQEQIKVAMKGGGYVEYYWNLPNSEAIESKISYQNYDPDWGWIISAGAYESEFNKQATSMLTIILTVVAATILLGVVGMYIFSSKLSQRINMVNEALDRIARGDLTGDPVHINSNDEIKSLGDSYNSMLASLREMIETSNRTSGTVTGTVARLSEVTDESTKAINEVVLTIQEISEAVSEEAAGAELVSEKMSVLSSSIERLESVSQTMGEALKLAEEENRKGIESVNTLGTSAQDSLKVVHEIESIIHEMKEGHDKISAFTDVINSIAEQTNLLALNASIEAARAGEAGRGFSVVAEEIRKLAEESGKSVTDIKGIIDEIESSSLKSVEQMAIVTKTVNTQSGMVKATSSQFASISDSVHRLCEDINFLNTEVENISELREDILTAILNVSASTEQTSAATTEVSASSEEQLAGITEIDEQMKSLVGVVKQLDEAIHKFKI